MSEITDPRLSTSWYRELDIVAVFCLAVLPDIANCFAVPDGPVDYGFTFIHLSLIARSLQVAVPILLIMQLRNVRWADYGFTKFRPIADVAIGLGLCVLSYVLFVVLYNVMLLMGFDLESSSAAIEDVVDDAMPHSSAGFLFVVASGLANGFAEELAIRSYLLSRIREATSSSVFAIALTTVMFAAYHGYQGSLGVANALAIGIAFGIFMERYRRFWPLALAHAALDILPQLG